MRVLGIGLVAPVVGTVLALAGSWGWPTMRNAVYWSTVRRGVHECYRRVRWRVARSLAFAWVIALPASFGIASLAGLMVAVLST
jgi:phosphate/sulfate permease